MRRLFLSGLLGLLTISSASATFFWQSGVGHRGPVTFVTSPSEPPTPSELSSLQTVVDGMDPGTWHLLPNTDPADVLTTDAEIDDIVTANPGSSDFAPNTHSKAVFEAWCGAAYDPVGHNMYFTGGGHGDYGGNEVYRFSFETLSWTRMMPPSPVGTVISGGTFDGELIPDEGPISTHTYTGFVWNPATGTAWNTGLRSGYNSFNPTSGNSVDPPIKAAWEFDPETATWSDYHTLIESANFYHPTAVYLPGTEEILVFWQPTSSSYRYASFFDTAGNQTQANSGAKMDSVWSDTSTAVRIPNDGPASIAGHIFVISPQGIEEYSITGSTISVVGTTRSLPTLSPDPGKVYQDGMAWDPDDNLFYLWDGAQETYTWDPVTDTWTNLANSGTTEAPAGPYGVGSSVLFSKWVYIEEVGAFAGIQAVDDGGVWIYKPPVTQTVLQTVTIDADSTATLPFTFGTVFTEGAVATTPSLDDTNLTASDAACMSTWPDGSCRYAVFSGRAPLSTTPISVDIYNTPGSSGTALAESDIATAVAALGETSIQLGSIGTVDLADLTGSPVDVPIAGPEMVEAIYRTTGIGSNTHLMVEIDVRLYADDRMWIAFTVSNGLIGQDTKTDSFQADYVPTIKIDGSTVYNNGAATYNHNEFTSWTYDGWVGGDPGVYVKPDTAAWIASKMVPNFVYGGPSETNLDGLLQTYTQGSRGDLVAAMGTGGYQHHIGLLTLTSAWVVTSEGDERAAVAAQVEAKSLQSFPIALPGVSELRAIAPDEYPTWTINGAAAGGAFNWSTDGGTLTYDNPHHPHAAFIPYLMTADPRYLETLWNVASACFLQMADTAGSGEARLLIAQERDLAWCLESVAQAIAISPDDDPRIASYQAWMASNFDAWTGDQVTTLGINHLYGMNYTGMNTFGYTFSYNGGTGSDTAYGDGKISSFMQDFWMSAIGYARDLQAFPDTTAAADLAAYEAHLDGARVKTLGGSGSSDYCFGDAATYTMRVTTLSSNDPRDWDDTAGELYDNNYGTPNGTCGDSLNDSTVPGGVSTPTSAHGQWANLMPAISYACDHEVTGACPAWEKIYTSSNITDQTVTADYPNDGSMFGIWPRGYTP